MLSGKEPLALCEFDKWCLLVFIEIVNNLYHFSIDNHNFDKSITNLQKNQ